MLSHFSYVQFFVTPRTVAHRLLCPWNSPGKNTGVGCHSSSRGSSWPRVGTHVCYVSCIDMWVLYHWATCVCLVAKSCPTLCDTVDCSPPGSSAHGIFQARILEWVAIPPAGDLPDPGIEYPVLAEFSALEGAFFTTEPPGKPFIWDLGQIKKIKSDFFFIILDLGNQKKINFFFSIH